MTANVLQCIDINDFEKLEKLGEGSSAETLKVRQKSTNDIYAAKSLKQGIDIRSKPISNDTLFLIREVNNMSKLNHPSIVKIYGLSPINFFGEQKPVIILEYAKSQTLKKVLEDEKENHPVKGWDATKKLCCLYCIASAMKYLHSHNIIHRDLKPENILIIDMYLLPLIIDFGLSVICHSNQDSLTLPSVKTMKGTPIYMAPEIYRDDIYSKESDIFAFAMIMHQVMTLDTPYSNCKNLFQVEREILKGTHPDFNVFVPDAYRNLIERCWNEDPTKRPSFDEIENELKNNPGFITEEINEYEFRAVVRYIDEYRTTFDAENRIIDIDLYINRPNKDKQIIKKKTNPIFKLFNIFNSERKPLTNFFNKFKSENKSKKIYPDEYYGLLDENGQNLVKNAVNDHEKQFIIGKNLIEGINNFPIIIEIGVKYLEESISQGNVDSAIYLSNKILHDKLKLFPKDLNWAKGILSKFLRNEDDRIYYLLGKIMKKQNHFSEALKYFEKGAKNEHVDSLYECAKLYYSGIGGKQDMSISIDYYKLSAEKGNKKSVIFLQHYYPFNIMTGFRNLPFEIQQFLISNIIKYYLNNEQYSANDTNEFTIIFQPKHLRLFNLINSNNLSDLISFFPKREILININYSQIDNHILNQISIIKNKMNNIKVNLNISGIKKLVRLDSNFDLYNTITIDNSLIKMQDAAFSSLTNLEKITFPRSITEISESLLCGCTSIKKIEIPDSVKIIKDKAFMNCRSLTEVIIPESVESIGISTFESCISLEKIKIPDSKLSINRNAFLNCSSLEYIVVPSSVTYIGENAFENCIALKQIKILSHIKSLEYSIFHNCTSLIDIELPQTIISIGVSAFQNCKSLRNITLPESIKSINHDAFKNCLKLEQIIIPSQVTSIEDNAFENCQALKRIIIPQLTSYLGDYVFRNCENLTQIVINSLPSSIRFNTFDDCPSLNLIVGENIPDKIRQIAYNAYPYNKKKAYRYYKIAADSGDIESMYKVALMMKNGIMIQQMEKKKLLNISKWQQIEIMLIQ